MKNENRNKSTQMNPTPLPTESGGPVPSYQDSLNAGEQGYQEALHTTIEHSQPDGETNTVEGIALGNPNANVGPNSFGAPREVPLAKEPPLKISGDADRYDHREGHDDFTQVRDLFIKVFGEEEKHRLFMIIAGTWGSVPEEICQRQLALFEKVQEDYATGVRTAWEKVKSDDEYKPNAAPVTQQTPQSVEA